LTGTGLCPRPANPHIGVPVCLADCPAATTRPPTATAK
jgi:hypothetical protein